MIELTVTGMTCEGCVTSVRRAVERVLPNSNPQIDLASGRVRVAVELSDLEGIRERIIAAIEAAGFGALVRTA
jgi:copper chaperone CopZ